MHHSRGSNVEVAEAGRQVPGGYNQRGWASSQEPFKGPRVRGAELTRPRSITPTQQASGSWHSFTRSVGVRSEPALKPGTRHKGPGPIVVQRERIRASLYLTENDEKMPFLGHPRPRFSHFPLFFHVRLRPRLNDLQDRYRHTDSLNSGKRARLAFTNGRELLRSREP